MGLDISVYKNIKKIDPKERSVNFPSFRAFVIEDAWMDRIKNLEAEAYYTGEIQECGVSYVYSRHTYFRLELLRLVGREDLITATWIEYEQLLPEVPFYELIDFADNEGCLDWEVSEKLYNDFVKFKDKVAESEELWFKHKYSDWLEVFESAKDKGVVVFH